MATDQQIDRALRFDPLANAERMTGVDWHDDAYTQMLGLSTHVEHGQKTDRLLREADDTTFHNTLERYQRIIGEEGFEQVLSLPFTDPVDGKAETYFIYFQRRDGILLSFDTWGWKDVNGGSFYYNVRPKSAGSLRYATSTGGYEEDGNGVIWSGNHDCREALRFHIRQLRSGGDFVTPWVKPPFIWLLHYGDRERIRVEPHGFYKQINRERIGMLPDWVQEAIAICK